MIILFRVTGFYCFFFSCCEQNEGSVIWATAIYSQLIVIHLDFMHALQPAANLYFKPSFLATRFLFSK